MKYDFIVGVPCSKLAKFIKENNVLISTREDEAMALACGSFLVGKKPLVFMQNSGLGCVTDIVTSLYKPYNLPLPKLVLSIRHKPEHHSHMGKITKELLKILEWKNVDIMEEEK